ncbi:uncharacterized protein LOC110440287 [Mizuhopecten yessoensis]|uniref:SH2 domain-containing protein n=1 Tax=Mizuhopecten yessoensis TaxID=6573 RepID=A0A210PLH1_MIZYE|nr:uncharacterized protein LOC110440287 [Mizuhopecten yessoensis]OWF37348.1 hypothetical protein KP79_PYT18359 [Mizuhopecten yessoensis]
MGFGISKQVTINQRNKDSPRSTVIVFSKEDAESVLKGEETGTYLLYRDHDTDRLYLSLRSSDYVEHHRVNFEDNLYYMDNQPYPYLDSIVLYHQKHRLNGTKLTHHAQLSARTVKMFTMKVTARNGNVVTDDSVASDDAEVPGDDVRIPGIEHTNDMVLGRQRISKSSGRLWMSGMQKSLKRMSVSESYDLQEGIYSTRNDIQPNSPVRGNGHVTHLAAEESDESDDLDDVRKYMFENEEGLTEHNSASNNNIVSGRYSGYVVDESDIELCEDQSSLFEDESNILYCSHL